MIKEEIANIIVGTWIVPGNFVNGTEIYMDDGTVTFEWDGTKSTYGWYIEGDKLVLTDKSGADLFLVYHILENAYVIQNDKGECYARWKID